MTASDTTTAVYHNPNQRLTDGHQKSPEKNGGHQHDESQEEGAVGLKANINLFGAIMISVGSIIGSGIFVSSKGVHENAGSVGMSLIIWFLCGLFSAVGSYCYAELGTLITKSGGDYAYVQEAFGPFIAFIRLWVECIVIRPCTLTAVAITFAVYVLRPIFPHCDSPAMTPQFLAAGCLILLALVNSLSVKWTTLVQNVFTIAKLLALVVIILTGFYLLGRGGENLTNFKDIMAGTSTDPGNIALAFYSGLWAFNGWNYLSVVTEEIMNPRRNLPLAIGISCTMCTAIYIFANMAFYAGVTLDDIVDSPAVAVTFAEYHYGWFSWIMPVCVALSCFGTVNGVLLSSSRLFYVAARENHMPAVLSMINPYTGTPVPSVLFILLLSFGYFLISENIYQLINYVQIVNWTALGLATVGLIVLRYKAPYKDHPRSIRVNLIFPVIFSLGCAALLMFSIIKTPKDAAIGLALLATSIPVYFIFVKWQNKPAFIANFIDSLTLGCQKLMLVVGEKKD